MSRQVVNRVPKPLFNCVMSFSRKQEKAGGMFVHSGIGDKEPICLSKLTLICFRCYGLQAGGTELTILNEEMFPEIYPFTG